MLQREAMTDQNYSYAKRVLDGILKENADDVEAVKRYAKVYLTKTNTDLLTAGRMLEKAMELSPLDEEVYFLYRAVRGGSEYKQHSDNDWFIRVYEPYARKYPQNYGLYRMLIEAMISKKYFEKAEELLAGVKFEGENKYMREVLLGDIALAKGDEQAAPRKMDMMYSLAFLYKKLGRFAEAKKEWELIMKTLISEYGVAEEANDITWAKSEIAQLDVLLGTRQINQQMVEYQTTD